MIVKWVSCRTDIDVPRKRVRENRLGTTILVMGSTKRTMRTDMLGWIIRPAMQKRRWTKTR